MVGRVAGAPVIVSPGWFVAAVVLTVVLAPTLSRLSAVRTPAGGYGLAAGFVLMLFVSVFLHELGHALVARRQGVVVRELAVTLLGGHTQLGGAAPGPGASALVAVAGPAANLLLATGAWFAAQATTPGSVPWALLGAAALANGVVGAVNLLPALPLDGGRVLEAGLWRATGERWRGTLVAGWAGRLLAVVLVVWALVPPVLTGTPPSLTRIAWAALLSAFLWSGAGAAVGMAGAERRLRDVRVAALMSPAVAVPARGTVADLSGVPHGTSAVLVDSRGRPLAVVDPAAVLSVPDHLRDRTALEAVARPLPEDAVVHEGMAGPDAVEVVARVARRSDVLAVVADGRVVGVLSSTDVVRALRA